MKKQATATAAITIIALVSLFFTACQQDQSGSVLSPSSSSATKSGNIQMTVPSDRYYTDSHEWIKINGDSTALVGITEYAAAALSAAESSSEEEDIFITLPRKKKAAKINGTLASKPLLMPVTGTIDSYNPSRNTNPSWITSYPYTTGWVLKLKNISFVELGQLMNAAQYESYINGLSN